MIVATGVTCAVGFGSLAVLMLGLHAQIRRLTRMAEAVQSSLQANLRELLAEARQSTASAAPPPGTQAAPPPPPPPVRPRPTPELELELEPPVVSPSVVQLAAATTMEAPAAAPPPRAALPAGPTGADPGNNEPQDLASRWNPDRRLLVMRLAARGNRADQIAAALRIPLEEIELFLKINKLVKNEAFVEAVRNENLPAAD